MDKQTYIPMNKLVYDKDTKWTFTNINLSYIDIAKRGIIIWCVKNIEKRWTMTGGNGFGFEDPYDATMFKIQFGFNS